MLGGHCICRAGPRLLFASSHDRISSCVADMLSRCDVHPAQCVQPWKRMSSARRGVTQRSAQAQDNQQRYLAGNMLVWPASVSAATAASPKLKLKLERPGGVRSRYESVHSCLGRICSMLCQTACRADVPTDRCCNGGRACFIFSLAVRCLPKANPRWTPWPTAGRWTCRKQHVAVDRTAPPPAACHRLSSGTCIATRACRGGADSRRSAAVPRDAGCRWIGGGWPRQQRSKTGAAASSRRWTNPVSSAFRIGAGPTPPPNDHLPSSAWQWATHVLTALPRSDGAHRGVDAHHR